MAKRKYKITVVHSMGPYKTTTDVAAVKKAVRAKLPKMTFTAHKKQRDGYKFTGKITYIKHLDAPKNVVEAAVKKLAPGARVSVSIMN